MTKKKLKQEARRLRKKGFGIKTIAYKLQVSSSTVSIWCKDIVLKPEQIAELNRRARDPFHGRRKDHIRKQKMAKLENVKLLREKGIQEVGKLLEKEFFIAGIALYWAEGFKKDKRLGFANSDPQMIRFFLHWLIRICHVPKKNIRVRVGLNISHKNRVEVVEKYWSQVTQIPKSHFQKPYFQKFIWKKEFPNPEKYFGVLRLRANKQLPLFRKIHGWIEGLKLNI